MNPWLSISRRVLGMRVGVSTPVFGKPHEVEVLRAEKALLIAKNTALRATLQAVLQRGAPLSPQDRDSVLDVLRKCRP